MIYTSAITDVISFIIVVVVSSSQLELPPFSQPLPPFTPIFARLHQVLFFTLSFHDFRGLLILLASKELHSVSFLIHWFGPDHLTCLYHIRRFSSTYARVSFSTHIRRLIGNSLPAYEPSTPFPVTQSNGYQQRLTHSGRLRKMSSKRGL